jgi:hypothetical protein
MSRQQNHLKHRLHAYPDTQARCILLIVKMQILRRIPIPTFQPKMLGELRWMLANQPATTLGGQACAQILSRVGASAMLCIDCPSASFQVHSRHLNA